jgi:hypothetical protein
MGSMVQYYAPQQLALGGKRPEGLKAEPKYRSPKPLYGKLVLGDGPDNRITVVLDEPEEGAPRIYVDQNHDKDLTNDGDGQWTQVSEGILGFSNVTIDVPYRTGTVPYTLEFYRFKDRMRECVLYFRNSAREGEIQSGGNAYKVAVLHENADGRFDNLAYGTLLVDMNSDGKLEGRPDSAEFHKLAEPFNVHGRVWEVPRSLPDKEFWTSAYVAAVSSWSEDADHVLYPISKEEVLTNWQTVASSPDWLEYGTAVLERQRFTLHETEAGRLEAEKNWFAAAFHLRWLCKAEPKNVDFQNRVRRATQELERARKKEIVPRKPSQ